MLTHSWAIIADGDGRSNVQGVRACERVSSLWIHAQNESVMLGCEGSNQSSRKEDS